MGTNARTTNIVVGSMIGICSGLFLWEADSERRRDVKALENINRNFVLSVANIREGRQYTILTSGLIHASLTHLVVNMVGLWRAGRIIVRFYGISTFGILVSRS